MIEETEGYNEMLNTPEVVVHIKDVLNYYFLHYPNRVLNLTQKLDQ